MAANFLCLFFCSLAALWTMMLQKSQTHRVWMLMHCQPLMLKHLGRFVMRQRGPLNSLPWRVYPVSHKHHLPVRWPKQIHKCALKLLPFFFSKEELASCNTDGSYGKGSLDATRLNNLKILLFTKFPNSSPLEKDKHWRAIKTKINAKCRASKFATSRQEPRVQ